MTVAVDIKALLEAGAHFGHKTSRWHPKMAPYIYTKRQNAHIINLEKTVEALNRALPLVAEMVKNGKKVLFVGTKKQISGIVRDIAEEVDMPYVTLRWAGGILTNVETVNRQLRKLKDLERKMETGELEARYSKLEVQRFQEEIDSLNARYGGIKEMKERPAAVIVADANEDKNAVREAKTLGIPVFALTDTNVDPTNIDYVIPMNDDSLKATELVLGYFADAIHEARGEAQVGAEARTQRRLEKITASGATTTDATAINGTAATTAATAANSGQTTSASAASTTGAAN